MAYNNPYKSDGVTLVEVLVTLVIFMTILAAVTTSWIRTGNLVDDMVVKSDLVEDVRNAAAIMGDGLTRAVYVYPPGTQLTLNASADGLVRNPQGGNLFTVGAFDLSKVGVAGFTASPIIAYLEAEENTAVPCAARSPEGCLTLVAYYLARRGDVTAPGMPLAFLRNETNDEQYMLFEYRRSLGITTEGLRQRADTIPNRVIQGQAQLLVDYIDPETLSISFDTCGTPATGNPVRVCPNTLGETEAELSAYTAINGSVSMRSAIERARGRKKYSPQISFAIAPRSLADVLLRGE